MLRGFFLGLSCLKSGFNLIRQSGIRRFVIVPISINVLVFIGLGWLLSGYFSDLLGWITPDPNAWYAQIVDKLLIVIWILFAMAIVVIFTYAFSVVANLIAAPFNSLLAERVEAHLRGSMNTKPAESLSHMIKSMPHILRSESGKIFYVLIWIIPLLLLYLIPGINIAAPFISFLFGAWMLSLEYIDYPMGNNGFYFGQVKKRMRSNRNTALGFGSAVTLITAIPVVNLIAMPVAVAGATKLWVDELSRQQMDSQK